jgi:glutamine---fructose-6-phosphate transaminase (isomerizing)
MTSTIPTAQYGSPNRVPVEDMMFEIANQSFAVGAALDRVVDQIRALPTAELAACEHVYLTGCGDSLYAGMAARMAFHRLARIPTDAVEALEFGRYTAELLPERSLVVGVSNSGKATRTVEALQCATDAGALSLAVTGDTTSRLAAAAKLVIDQRVERDGRVLTMPSNLDSTASRPSFGLANYLVSLTTLLALAAEIGRARGLVSDEEVARFHASLREAADTLDETVTGCADAAGVLAGRCAGEGRDLIILGAGPGLAMALFYGAKTYELARINGNVQQLEEWAHEQFFLCGPRTELLLVAPAGRSTDRSQEVAATAVQLGAHVTVVTDPDGAAQWSAGDTPVDIVPVARPVPEELVGIPYVAPGEIFATQVAKLHGNDAFQFDSDLQYVLNMTTIQESRQYRLSTPVDGRR